jgi:hypothetical protein
VSNPSVQRSQEDAPLAQHGGDLDEMAQPAEPIEPPHHERLARSEGGEGRSEDRPRGVGARRLFLEDHIDGCARQRIGLQRRRLVVRRDPRVANQTRRAVLDYLRINPAA